jgi:hypothetical protein
VVVPLVQTLSASVRVSSPPHISRLRGRGLALALLAAVETELEPTTRKFLRTFRAELASCADTGMADARMWFAVRALRAVAKCDVQANEGVNSLLKGCGKQAPRISLAVLDARVRLKRAMGLSSCRSNADRVSAVRSLFELCFEHAAETGQVLETTDRWQPPRATPQAVLPAEELNKQWKALAGEDAAWATGPCTRLHQHMKSPDISKAFVVAGPEGVLAGMEAHVVVEKHRAMCWTALCTLESLADGDRLILRIKTPLSFSSAMDVFRPSHAQVAAGQCLQVYFLTLEWRVGVGSTVADVTAVEESFSLRRRLPAHSRRRVRADTAGPPS